MGVCHSKDEPEYIKLVDKDNELEKIIYFSEKLTKWSKEKILSANPNLSIQFILTNKHIIKFSMVGLSGNINTTWEVVCKYPELKWDYKILSINPNITWNIVERNLHKNWDFNMLSLNINITPKIVKDNPSFDWNFIYLHLNPNFKNEPQFNSYNRKTFGKVDVLKFYNNVPNIKVLKLENLSGKFLSEFCEHPAYTFDDVIRIKDKYSRLKFVPQEIFKNPNISIDNIKDLYYLYDTHPNSTYLSTNLFKYNIYSLEHKKYVRCVTFNLQMLGFIKDIINIIIKYVTLDEKFMVYYYNLFIMMDKDTNFITV
jgi:hypothetical protein